MIKKREKYYLLITELIDSKKLSLLIWKTKIFYKYSDKCFANYLLWIKQKTKKVIIQIISSIFRTNNTQDIKFIPMYEKINMVFYI